MQKKIGDMQRRGMNSSRIAAATRGLAALDDDQLASRLVDSRATLQQMLGRPVDYLAYPFRSSRRACGCSHARRAVIAPPSPQPGFNRRER
mgnify:CR=1 FL=1